ncbi:MAG: hypothetical protein AB7O38_26035 [Pirellulaceae bacterium]
MSTTNDFVPLNPAEQAIEARYLAGRAAVREKADRLVSDIEAQVEKAGAVLLAKMRDELRAARSAAVRRRNVH